MTLYFKTKKLQRQCSEEKMMYKTFGKELSIKLKQRLMELQAASTLKDVSHFPPPLDVMSSSIKMEYFQSILYIPTVCFLFLHKNRFQ